MLDQDDHSFTRDDNGGLLFDKLLHNNYDGEDHQTEEAESASASSKDNEVEPSENGRDTQSPVTITSDTAAELTKQLQFVGHNLVKLLGSMGQQPCGCHDCNKVIHKNLPEPVLGSMGGSTPATPLNDFNLDFSNVVKNIQKTNSDEVEYMEDGTIKRGRRSKYCTPDVKRQVAAYAELHGATAAAKKFDIPPAVAAYYHRKLRRSILGQDHLFKSISSMSPRKQGSFDNDPEMENNVSNASSNQLSSELFSKGACLRGRGRGRPKLIGDDLDAELVDYMVTVKERVPRGHLTATYALEVARGYITNKKPDILEENGGHINLKLTWAMKLVSRTNDRYREIHGKDHPDSLPADLMNNAVDDILATLKNETESESNHGSAPEITNVRALDLDFAFNQQPRSNDNYHYNMSQQNQDPYSNLKMDQYNQMPQAI